MSFRALHAAALLLVVAGCGTDQQRTSYPVEMAGLPLEAPNHHGWTIELEGAWVSVGTVRFVAGRPLFASTWGERMWRVFGGTAHAHPGHYHPGDALGELHGAHVVDLLASSPVLLGVADAITGEYGSAEVLFPPPHANVDPDRVLRGNSVRLIGTAVRGEREVPFEAGVELKEALEGIAFMQSIGEEPGRVRISIRLARWLERVDFETAVFTDGEARGTFPADSQGRDALRRGITDTSAYSIEWLED